MPKSKEQTGKFTFKQFGIIHQKSAMKVGTDGVLLGAWAEINHAKRILDIGTGSGLIALMTAQKNKNALIDAIDIDKEASMEAQLNVNNSSWSERITVYHTSIQDFNPPYKFDSIISNPPFFQKGTKNTDIQRNTARQTDTLSLQDLIKHADRLLAANGEISIIIPTPEEGNILNIAEKYGCYIMRRTAFIPKENKPTERILLTFNKTKKEIIHSEIIHYNTDGSWTETYKLATKDFYLKL